MTIFPSENILSSTFLIFFKFLAKRTIVFVWIHIWKINPGVWKPAAYTDRIPGKCFFHSAAVLSGVVHWSLPSVISCHKSSKLTNGLCVKGSPLIYWPPLIDSEPIISIMADSRVHVLSRSPPDISRTHFVQIPWTRREALEGDVSLNPDMAQVWCIHDTDEALEGTKSIPTSSCYVPLYWRPHSRLWKSKHHLHSLIRLPVKDIKKKKKKN